MSCCNGPTTSIDSVLDATGDLEASARNQVVIARTPGATVTLPDDMDTGDTIIIAAPAGAITLAVPTGFTALPVALQTLAAGQATEFLFVAPDCGCGGQFLPVCCDPLLT